MFHTMLHEKIFKFQYIYIHDKYVIKRGMYMSGPGQMDTLVDNKLGTPKQHNLPVACRSVLDIRYNMAIITHAIQG